MRLLCIALVLVFAWGCMKPHDPGELVIDPTWQSELDHARHMRKMAKGKMLHLKAMYTDKEKPDYEPKSLDWEFQKDMAEKEYHEL